MPPAAPSAARYAADEALRDGRLVEIRAYAPGDREALMAAVGRMSSQSLYRRFFTVKRGFSEREQDFFLNVDFDSQVALVAWMEEGGTRAIVGGARYVRLDPVKAEVAFVVIDAYQGLGLGTALLRHLAVVARAAGLQELVAEVLPENRPMLKVFANAGLPMTTSGADEVVHVTLALA
jgi:RimJ/RimL family protein N-acetyltransferase